MRPLATGNRECEPRPRHNLQRRLAAGRHAADASPIDLGNVVLPISSDETRRILVNAGKAKGRFRLVLLQLSLKECSPMRLRTVTAFTLLTLPLACIAQTTPAGSAPPRSWVDKDTGHRVWRLSDEHNSGGFYFNVNAYTPDGKQMIYTAPDGIHVMDLATRDTKLLVENPPLEEGARRDDARRPGAGAVHALVAGYKTNSVFFTKTDP